MMQTSEPLARSTARAKEWLAGSIDADTRKQVETLLKREDPKLLIDSFYQSLEFGTGGLRGIMGVGSNCINRYTIGSATQGLANYLKKSFPGQEIRVAIAYDSRNNSPYFAQVTADVFSANGITVFLFSELRPTPLLSFAIRHLKCLSGIVITASSFLQFTIPDKEIITLQKMVEQLIDENLPEDKSRRWNIADWLHPQKPKTLGDDNTYVFKKTWKKKTWVLNKKPSILAQLTF